MIPRSYHLCITHQTITLTGYFNLQDTDILGLVAKAWKWHWIWLYKWHVGKKFVLIINANFRYVKYWSENISDSDAVGPIRKSIFYLSFLSVECDVLNVCVHNETNTEKIAYKWGDDSRKQKLIEILTVTYNAAAERRDEYSNFNNSH